MAGAAAALLVALLGSPGPVTWSARILYTDGDAIFAHGHRRRHDGGDIRSPGMYVLFRSCAAASESSPLAGASLEPTAEQQVALLASVPLTAERWEPLAEGEVVVLREGRVMGRSVGVRASGRST